MMEMEAQPQPAPNGNPYEVALFKYCWSAEFVNPWSELFIVYLTYNHNRRNFAGLNLHEPVNENDGMMKSVMQTWRAKMMCTDCQISLQLEARTIPALRFLPFCFHYFFLISVRRKPRRSSGWLVSNEPEFNTGHWRCAKFLVFTRSETGICFICDLLTSTEHYLGTKFDEDPARRIPSWAITGRPCPFIRSIE